MTARSSAGSPGAADSIPDGGGRGAGTTREHYRERAKLVSATQRMLSTTDGTSITVQDILEAAALSTRAFYRHFESKEDLLAEVLRADARRVESMMLRAMGAASAPETAIVAWLDFWLDIAFSSAYVNRLRAVTDGDSQVADALNSVRLDVDATSRAVVALTIETGLQRGVFATGVPFDDSMAFHAIVADVLDRRVHHELVAKRSETRAELLGVLSRALGVDLTSRG